MIKPPPIQEAFSLDKVGRINNAAWIQWLNHVVSVSATEGELVTGDTSYSPTIKQYTDHIIITNGNPHGTDHSQLDAVLQADDTSTSATGGKHVTDAQLKQYKDHLDLIDNNPHGTNWNQLEETVNYIPMDITPTSIPTTEGTVSWSALDHTLNVQSEIADSILQVGQENWVRGVNKTLATITDGQCVYVSGAQGNRPKISLAKADAENTSYTIGVATADILNNAEGYVTVFGLVRGYNTSGSADGEGSTTWADGQILYLSKTTAGALTKTPPAAPAHRVMVAIALNSTNNGMIFVNPSIGYELDELHDVLVTTPANYELLIRDQTAGYWKNSTKVRIDDTNTTIYSDSNGGTANDLNIDCGTGKTLALAKTVWNDTMAASALFRTTGGTGLTFAQFQGNIWANRFDIGDIFYVQIQLPHDYKLNTVIKPHLHLAVNAAVGATNYNVEVTTEQSWANSGSVFPTPTVVSTGLVESFQNVAQYTHKIMALTDITPTTGQGGISSYINFKVERITPSVQPLTGTQLFILGMDLHYEVDTMGSRTATQK